METLKQDLRYGIRMLLRSPGFTAIAILTLALGIGANVAIFTFVNAVLLRPLPFTHPEQLVRIFDDLSGANLKNVGMSVPEMEDLRDRSGVFDGLTVIWPVSAALTGGDHPERIELMVTSPNYFHLLGVKPQLGRVYGPEDAVPGFSDAALISDGLWKRQFGKDPNILGKKIRIDTDLYTVVGVVPAGFEHPGETVQGNVDIYAACGYSANPFPTPPKRSQNFLPGAIGRIKAGMTLAQAQAQLDAFAAHLRQAYPNDYPAVSRWSLRLEPVQENLTGKVRTTLLVLLTAVGFVLLIACVNIASLLLARSSGRIRELAIRRALGAARGRIVRQLLTESLLLAVAGGATALAVLFVLGDSLVTLMPADLPRLNEVHFDLRVVGFAFLLSVATGIIFGLLPALHAADADPNHDLKLGNRTGGGGVHQNRFRSALVTAEIALSLMLLIAAGLLVRSFWDTLQVRPGFEPKNLVVAQIWIPVPNNPAMNPYLKPADRSAFVREVLRRVSALPGVEEAAIGSGNSIPFVNVRNSFPIYFSDDPNAGGARLQAEFASVTPRYLDTVKAPLVAGRFFSDSDAVGSQPVLVVNETFVKRYSAAREAVGRKVRFVNGNGPDLTIVGVVGDLHDDGLDAPAAPHIYLSMYQGPGYALAIYLRTSAAPEMLKEAVTQQVHTVNPELPVFGVRTMEELMSASMARRKFVLELMALFAVVALLLAALGVYGVMAYAVTQRTQEIGIRMALGAQPRDILLLALRPGLILTGIGVLIGLVGAMGMTRLIASLLFGVTPTDPVTFIGVPAVLAGVALAACWIPARRATKVDPIVALHYE